MYGRHATGSAGPLEIVGRNGWSDLMEGLGAVPPACAKDPQAFLTAMRAVIATPAFQAMVQAAQCANVPPMAMTVAPRGVPTPAPIRPAPPLPRVNAPAAQWGPSQAGPGVSYGGTPQTQQQPVSGYREYPLGFFQDGITASTVADVISRPQHVFRGERVVIPASVGANFLINDLKVGNRSQLLNSEPIPAAAFAEGAVGTRMSFDTAAIAQDMSFSVFNTSATSQTFQATIFGTVAQY